jgi:hypothetical protein
MVTAAADCPSVCACCEPSGFEDEPAADIVPTPKQAVVPASPQADAQRTVQPAGCMCRPQTPVAPGPKQPQEKRSEPTGPDRVAASETVDPHFTLVRDHASVPVHTHVPRKVPAYLRNARLLI